MDEKNSGPGLLQRLVVGIFVPVVLAFLIMASALFVGVNLGSVRFASIKDVGIDSLNELGSAALKESASSLNSLGEKVIREKARDVAKQIEVYMKSYPGKTPPALSNDPRLKEIALQKVGETGYTAVHDTRGINQFHVNPQIVGTDLHALADKLPGFVKILDEGMKGPAQGYYDWKDADGSIRPKFMVTVPVEGSNLIVAATTYIDEFSRPAREMVERIKQVQTRYKEEYNKRFLLFILIIVVDLAVLLGVLYLYFRSVVRPIRHLSEVADKISMGDLGATIDVKGKGEVQVLAQSIKRMQTSVKAAMERLQKARETTASGRTRGQG